MDLNEKVVEFQRSGETNIGKEILLEAYNIANIIIYKSYYSFGHYDDLYSISHDAIVNAIKGFNPTLSSFSSFCSCCIKRDINRFIRRRNKQVLPNSNAISQPAQFLDIKEGFKNLSNREREYILGKRQSKWGYCRSLKKLKELLK